MSVTLPVSSTRTRTHSRRKVTQSKKDYTKDNAVRWFILLLVAVAAYIIIDTLSSREAPAVNYSAPPTATDKESKPAVDYAHHAY